MDSIHIVTTKTMATASPYKELLLLALRSSVSESAIAWMETAQNKLHQSQNLENDFLTLSAMARRKLGKQTLAPNSEAIETAGGQLALTHWRCGDTGRVILLLELCELRPTETEKWAALLFHHGDEAERISVLHALPLLPQPETLKQIALEAGRTNSLKLFSAIAQNNPYPCTYYNDHEFNPVVIKSLFNGLNIDPIMGLTERANPALSKMCEEYADERLAANRSLPYDIWLAIAPYASTEGKNKILKYLGDQEQKHRLFAIIALGRNLSSHPEYRKILKQTQQRETDDQVLSALQKYIT